MLAGSQETIQVIPRSVRGVFILLRQKIDIQTLECPSFGFIARTLKNTEGKLCLIKLI